MKKNYKTKYLGHKVTAILNPNFGAIAPELILCGFTLKNCNYFELVFKVSLKILYVCMY